ncbi:MAG TPA: fused MFS/spermidine synthase [Candidatus Saccharimonadales bacterium]|nr:fused MFS/spermidine synthase [Candidatus Saccharimonadales bacterium]
MKKFLRAYLLPIAVFITGASVLVVEVVAVRVLSPYYGNTMYTVSSVISVILLALSFGYYAGGKLADRFPSLKWFFGIIFISGLTLLLFHFLGAGLLPYVSLTLSNATGPLVSAILLFLLPAVLLGTLSPYAVKLQSVYAPKQGVGSVAGNIFFWSTLGSITGSLLAGFVLIPHFGITQILIATGIVLSLLGLLPLLVAGIAKKYWRMSLFGLGIMLAVTMLGLPATNSNIVYTKDGMYEKITIYDGKQNGRPVRFFQQDHSHSGAMFLDSSDPTDLVYGYTHYYGLYNLFTPRVDNALVIGGGAYSIPKALLHELPQATVDVSEIEPSLHAIAKQYFNLQETPRLHNYAQDGRRLLRDSPDKYDLIFSDVYYSFYSVPAHFTTQEFFRVAKDGLRENGVFIASMIGDLSRRQPSLIMSEIKTFRSVFPNSYFFAVESPSKTLSQNIIFVGYNSDNKVTINDAALDDHPYRLIRSLPDQQLDLNRFDLSPYPVLTDNFSPVDYMTAAVLQRTFNERGALRGSEMLALIDQQLRYGPRYLGAWGHKKTQQFLQAEMQAITEETTVQSWRHKGKDGKTYELMNIIGRLYPEKERRIVLAAHYDSKQYADKDKKRPGLPVPGANDSASGVAVLVEVARALARSPEGLDIGVDFVFFDGEEGDEPVGRGYEAWQPLGSTYFAEHLPDLYGTTKPELAVVLDMVCGKNARIYKEKSSMEAAGKQADAFWQIGRQAASGIFRDSTGQVVRDDHTSLNKAGIPSFLVIDYNYSAFHTTGDTIDKCSTATLESVSQTVAAYVTSLQ